MSAAEKIEKMRSPYLITFLVVAMLAANKEVESAFVQNFKPISLYSGAKLAKFSPILKPATLSLRPQSRLASLKMSASAPEKFEFQVF